MKIEFKKIDQFIIKPENSEDGALLDNLADGDYRYLQINSVKNDNRHIPEYIIIEALKK